MPLGMLAPSSSHPNLPRYHCRNPPVSLLYDDPFSSKIISLRDALLFYTLFICPTELFFTLGGTAQRVLPATFKFTNAAPVPHYLHSPVSPPAHLPGSPGQRTSRETHCRLSLSSFLDGLLVAAIPSGIWSR